MTFDDAFEQLTDHAPFPWQKRLYNEFASGRIPPSCNLPTGLGKTSVVAVWLIALAKEANGAKVPRRLVYVVNGCCACWGVVACPDKAEKSGNTSRGCYWDYVCNGTGSVAAVR